MRDIEKQREHWRNWYHNNKANARANKAKQEAVKVEWMTELKSTLKCSRCGFSHPAAIDFHHRDPNEKSFDISNYRRKSKKKILEEIAKCDILCANCHRILHYKEREVA